MLGRIDIYWHDSAGSHFFISSRSAERRIPRYASDNRRRNREKWPRPFGLRWKSGVPSDRSSSLGWKSGVPSDRSSSLGWKSGHTSFSPSTVACHSLRTRPRLHPTDEDLSVGAPVLAGFSLATLRVSICRYALGQPTLASWSEGKISSRDWKRLQYSLRGICCRSPASKCMAFAAVLRSNKEEAFDGSA